MYALLAAVVVVLQLLSTYIKFGTVEITLALTPIIVGAAIYGWKCGAFLGFVMSAVIFIMGVSAGGAMIPMVQYNLPASIIVCFGKGIAAGAVAGIVYKVISKKSPVLAAFSASALTPIVNTGIYIIGMITIFNGYLTQGSTESSPILSFILLVLSINFFIELAVNLVLATVITRVVDYYNAKLKKQ